MSIIDSIRLSGTTYQIQGEVTVDAALDSGSTNPVANSAITTALDNKVNVVDNEVPDYMVESEITYQGGYPSQSETASTWDDASMFTLRYNYIRISEVNYTTTAAVIDPSNNITTGRVTVEESVGNPLPDYIDMSFSDNVYRFTAKEGYRIAHLDIYNDKWAAWGYIREERVETVFEGGQSADVIKDVIEPTLINKQDQLVSGTNIKTINNTSILGSGNIDIQGGGKAIEAGRGISITTGETADTVSFDLPISAGTGTNSIAEGESVANGYNSHAEGNGDAEGNYSHAEGYGTQANNLASHAEGRSTTASGQSSHAEGDNTKASGDYSHAEGDNTTASGQSSHAEGYYTKASGDYSHAEGIVTQANGQSSHAEGFETIANNNYEHASGHFNVSSSASTTFGDSGNTLFSVGNGTTSSSRHNAFEIRQNGDIYLSSGGTDIKLQDHLGGGGSTYTAGDGIDITNDVISVTGKVDTSTYNTYTAATDTALASKADTATTYTKTEVDTALGGKADTSAVTEVSDALTAHTANTTVHTTAAEKTSWNGAVTNASNAVTALGGLSLIKLTQAEYDALLTKDNNTLYVIVN